MKDYLFSSRKLIKLRSVQIYKQLVWFYLSVLKNSRFKRISDNQSQIKDKSFLSKIPETRSKNLLEFGT